MKIIAYRKPANAKFNEAAKRYWNSNAAFYAQWWKFAYAVERKEASIMMEALIFFMHKVMLTNSKEYVIIAVVVKNNIDLWKLVCKKLKLSRLQQSSAWYNKAHRLDKSNWSLNIEFLTKTANLLHKTSNMQQSARNDKLVRDFCFQDMSGAQAS